MTFQLCLFIVCRHFPSKKRSRNKLRDEARGAAFVWTVGSVDVFLDEDRFNTLKWQTLLRGEQPQTWAAWSCFSLLSALTLSPFWSCSRRCDDGDCGGGIHRGGGHRGGVLPHPPRLWAGSQEEERRWVSFHHSRCFFLLSECHLLSVFVTANNPNNTSRCASTPPYPSRLRFLGSAAVNSQMKKESCRLHISSQNSQSGSITPFWDVGVGGEYGQPTSGFIFGSQRGQGGVGEYVCSVEICA